MGWRAKSVEGQKVDMEALCAGDAVVTLPPALLQLTRENPSEEKVTS
jgi:hypothetical protein